MGHGLLKKIGFSSTSLRPMGKADGGASPRKQVHSCRSFSERYFSFIWSNREVRVLNVRSSRSGSGLNRCGKSCRFRWLNYLRPGIKRGNISPDEEDLILRLHKLLGNRLTCTLYNLTRLSPFLPRRPLLASHSRPLMFMMDAGGLW